VDSVIEVNLTANAASYPSVVKPHGQVVVYGITGTEAVLPALWAMQNSIAIKFFLIYDIPAADRGAGLAELDALLRGGKLAHTIAADLPLSDIVKAHELVEGGALVGNVVLRV
jgi:NADPH2:quinone reductase